MESQEHEGPWLDHHPTLPLLFPHPPFLSPLAPISAELKNSEDKPHTVMLPPKKPDTEEECWVVPFM